MKIDKLAPSLRRLTYLFHSTLHYFLSLSSFNGFSKIDSSCFSFHYCLKGQCFIPTTQFDAGANSFVKAPNLQPTPMDSHPKIYCYRRLRVRLREFNSFCP